MASRNLTLRDQLRGAELAAKLARESVADLQRDRDRGREHVRHLLASNHPEWYGPRCPDCRAARDWAAE